MDFPTTGESSRGSLPTRSPSPTGDSEEDVQLDAAIEASLNDLDLPSATGGLNGERPYRASSDHIHRNLTRDDCAESDSNTYAPQIEGVVPPNLAHIQTSSQIPARSSRKTRDLDLLPDLPLRDSERVDATWSQADPERYVPWVGDLYGQSRGSWGLIPQLFPCVWILVACFLIGAFLFIFILVLTGGAYIQDFRYIGNVFASLELFTNFSTGTVNLLLILCVIVSHRDRVKKDTFWTAIIIGLIIFGLSLWAYYALIANDFASLWAWQTRSWPQSFRGCDARVRPQQSFLFTEVTYKTQFARVVTTHANGTVIVHLFDKDAFQSIQSNSTLCSQGFEGNEDLYGLGIRVGIYLQWIASLVANNLLPESRKELQRVWLVFSLAVCIATMISSFAVTCVFGIEIEILYWMYWGGFMCVFASSPSSTRLGSEAKWVVLDWVTEIQFITHMLMTYHGIVFIWYAYDQLFSRMPCGTYQFFFVPVLDPSESFSFLRDFLTQMICPLAFLSLLVFPYMSPILASEVKKSIQDSATYQMFFPRTEDGDRNQTESDAPKLPIRLSLGSRILKRLRKLYQRVAKVYRLFRTLLSLPPHSRSGIRLVTPLEVKNRRSYQIRCAALGLASCAISMTAIETTLHWNKVIGIYSLTSTGQYVSLTIGGGTFVSVCWRLVQQEGRRRRDLRRRRMLNQDFDGIELTHISNTFADAVYHAFGQPDAGFLTNDGALPTFSTAPSIEVDGISDSPGPLDMSHRTGNEYLMSGALQNVRILA